MKPRRLNWYPIQNILIEVRKGYGMEINVEKTKTMRISMQPTPLQIKIDLKTGGECGRILIFG
jgi:hypothetical protein